MAVNTKKAKVAKLTLCVQQSKAEKEGVGERQKDTQTGRATATLVPICAKEREASVKLRGVAFTARVEGVKVSVNVRAHEAHKDAH